MIDVILLAAGNSRRFGEKTNKLLWMWQGKPLYQCALRKWQQAAKERQRGDRIFVVAREQAILETAKEWGMIPVESPASEKGIAYSIRSGLQAAQEYHKEHGLQAAERIVFGVTDQPLLRKETLLHFLDEAEKAEYACLAWQEQEGNPVSFPAEAREELLLLEGDSGGKKVLRRHKEACVLVQTGSEEELWDIDTKRQYESMQAVQSTIS